MAQRWTKNSPHPTRPRIEPAAFRGRGARAWSAIRKSSPRESGAGIRFSYKSRDPEHRQRAQQHVAQRAAANPYPVISRADHPPCAADVRAGLGGAATRPVRKRPKKSACTPRLCTGALVSIWTSCYLAREVRKKYAYPILENT